MEMEGLKLIPYIALILAISGIILGAAAITLSKFGDSAGDKCINSTFIYNETTMGCHAPDTNNATETRGYGGNLTGDFYTIQQAQDGITTVAEQQQTVAIIAVMVIIISIIAGVFVYMKYFS